MEILNNMETQELIQNFLKLKAKSVNRFIKKQNKLIQKAQQQSDLDWSTNSDETEGRARKDAMLEASHFTVGYLTAMEDIANEVHLLLEKSADELSEMIRDYKKQLKKDSKKLAPKKIKKAKILPLSDPHEDWCELYETNRPWAIDEACTCPGASEIRAKMEAGMSLMDAKNEVLKTPKTKKKKTA
jgi:hypothetical protein